MRNALLHGPRGAQLRSRKVASNYIEVVNNGLQLTERKRRIIIVGAGISGLTAGSLLKSAGHDVVLLEASNRVGGRVKTVREPFSDGLYAEVGAMRLPAIHELLNAYIRKFHLETNPFVDEVPEGYVFVNEKKVSVREYRSNPDVLGYPISSYEQGKTADILLNELIQPIIDFIRADPANNWPKILEKYDSYSVRGFLQQARTKAGMPVSEGAIEMIGVLLDEEALMMTSFIESIRDQTDISPDNQYSEIKGGNDLLPRSFLPVLHDVIQYRTRVRALERDGEGIRVTCEHVDTLRQITVEGDCVILTIPFSALRHIYVRPPFSHEKRKTIRQLHYDTSTKILLQFRKAFWEEEGIFGGNTTTDLPIRFIYYPSHGWKNGGPSVLLASYTWGDDSLRWDSLSERERVRFALENVARIHGQQVMDHFVTGTSHSWVENEYTCGAFALFEPSQQTTLWPYIASRDDKVYFAGEHTTLQHAWIEGALESGIRAAIESNTDAGQPKPLTKAKPPTYAPPDKRHRPTIIAPPILSIRLAKAAKERVPRIAEQVEKASEQHVKMAIQSLAGFHTRHTLSDLNNKAAEWIQQQFQAFGYEHVKLHPFAIGDVERTNVLCTKSGEDSADEHMIICAHFDSRMQDLSDSSSRAPGADDNGSGTVVLLECSRLLADVRTRRSIQFVAFTGEEQGLLGATAYAQYVHGQGLRVRRVLNLDMVGHHEKTGAPSIVIEQAMEGTSNDLESQALASEMVHLAALYTSLDTRRGPIYSSDYMPFEHYGYVCNGLFDGADRQPFYHTSSDTLDKVDMSACTQVARLVVATALSFAEFV
jgi:monoamine oxidase